MATESETMTADEVQWQAGYDAALWRLRQVAGVAPHPKSQALQEALDLVQVFRRLEHPPKPTPAPDAREAAAG